MTRGQFLRLYIGTSAAQTKIVAAAKTLVLHCSTQFENSTTKDDSGGNWVSQDAVATSYDIQSGALILSDGAGMLTGSNGLNEMENFATGGASLAWSINNVSGSNNRTKGSAICSGMCHCTNLTVDATKKQNASYNASFMGDGAMTVGS